MKKEHKKIIIGGISVALIIVSCFIYAIRESFGLNFLVGNTDSDIIIRIALVCAAICLIIISVIAIVKKEKHRILKTLICFVASVAIFYFVGISAFFSRPYTYYDFVSPDGKYSVIAGEWSWLQGGGVNFYERTNPFLIKEIDSISTDDGYEPIKRNDYSVKWDENRMEFTANNGNGYYETIEIFCE